MIPSLQQFVEDQAFLTAACCEGGRSRDISERMIDLTLEFSGIHWLWFQAVTAVVTRHARLTHHFETPDSRARVHHLVTFGLRYVQGWQ
ncbi:MAG: hypothetical protein JNK57_20700 [Planctomycetaceae bacterium]|nr:hypothetical protein [Planctomycetaceae bacterium]